MQPLSIVLDILLTQPKQANYWLPILLGAIMGIGLAWWLRRRK
ncbi:MAG: LPXTG cell wall anchor domain-containing protein [Bacteroidetes bacterium]|nr:LPXTG cell wall anchor domain-containing protein [Bacteroidota bacterium]